MPNALRPMYRHVETSWGRERLSSVRSSSNSLATFTTSCAEGVSPVERTCVRVYDMSVSGTQDAFLFYFRTLRKNSLKASLPTMCALALSPDSRSVSWRNLAISSLTRKSLRCFSSCWARN